MHYCQASRARCRIARNLLIYILTPCWAPVSLGDVGLRFGVYAADQPTVVVNKFGPVVAELQRLLTKSSGRQVHITLEVAGTYEKRIQAAASGEVDIARVGPASYKEGFPRGRGQACKMATSTGPLMAGANNLRSCKPGPVPVSNSLPRLPPVANFSKPLFTRSPPELRRGGRKLGFPVRAA